MNCVNCSLWLGVCIGLVFDSKMDSVEDAGAKPLEPDIVEDEVDVENVEDNLSAGVDERVSADVKEDAEHDNEALALGSVRKQYSSSL